jgi:serine/threonine protein phosphatase PrpC
LNPKTWPNEDSVAVHRLEDGSYLAVVADAHWGGASSEAVVTHLLTAFGKARGETVRDRLHLALRGIDARFQREKAGRERSETTALLAHLDPDGTLEVMSIGDSVLVLVAPDGGCERFVGVPFRYPLPFLGTCPLATIPRSVPPEAHTLRLPPGHLALLATDGIEPEASGGLDDAGLSAILRGEGDLCQRLERLLARADDPGQGGGADNLGLVALLG